MTESDQNTNMMVDDWKEIIARLATPHAQPIRASLPLSSERKRRVSALIFISVICYPNDFDAREKFISALFAECFKRDRDVNENYIPGTEFLRGDIPQRNVDLTLKKTARRLMKALHVTWNIAVPVINERLGMPNGQPSLSKAMTEYTKASGTAIGNFRKRSWKPTIPVIHMALGLLEATGISEEPAGDANFLRLILADGPNWVPIAIQRSHSYLALLISANIIRKSDSVHLFDAQLPN